MIVYQTTASSSLSHTFERFAIIAHIRSYFCVCRIDFVGLPDKWHQKYLTHIITSLMPLVWL